MNTAGEHELLRVAWSDDLTTMTVTVKRADGMVCTTTYSWATVELAQKHSLDALLSALGATGIPREPGDNRRMRRVVTPYGTAYLSLNTGPPTWWKPRAKFGRRKDGAHEFMVGWLRALFAASWHPKERE